MKLFFVGVSQKSKRWKRLRQKVRFFCQDESRFGLIYVPRRRITLRGIKPVSQVKYKYDNYYLYGAVEPKTGEGFFLELPYLDSACFQIYLDEFSKKYRDSKNILLLDNGKFHKAKRLRIPKNLAFEFLPPYSPELNPIERLWQDLKGQIGGELFEELEQLQNRVADILRKYTQSTIRSLTAYPFFRKAINDVFQ